MACAVASESEFPLGFKGLGFKGLGFKGLGYTYLDVRGTYNPVICTHEPMISPKTPNTGLMGLQVLHGHGYNRATVALNLQVLFKELHPENFIP